MLNNSGHLPTPQHLGVDSLQRSGDADIVPHIGPRFIEGDGDDGVNEDLAAPGRAGPKRLQIADCQQIVSLLQQAHLSYFGVAVDFDVEDAVGVLDTHRGNAVIFLRFPFNISGDEDDRVFLNRAQRISPPAYKLIAVP